MFLGDLFDLLVRFVTSRRIAFIYIGAYVLLELVVRSRLTKPLVARGYAVDLLYCFFYRLGFFSLLMEAPIREFIYGNLSVQLFLDVPVWGRIIAYVLILDLGTYWVHRLQHAIPALWAFHQVHHSQEQLTIMSTYRLHPVDTWMRGIVGPVVTMVLVGLPPTLWLWIAILWEVVANLSHLEVNWTFGPLRHVFVSPVSHSIHHSIEERQQERNYGAILSVWDRIFGTADLGGARPAVIGLPGWSVRDSPIAHTLAPIRGLMRWARGLPMDEIAPLAPAPRETPAPRP